jgi:uncharacterized membrane protein YbhN (UPF0104 family)
VGGRAGTVLRAAFGVAGVVFLVVAFLRTLGDVRLLPVWPKLLLAAVVVCAGAVAACAAWLALVGDKAPRMALVRAFFIAQLAKYIPGLIWLPLGQVGWATRAGVPLASASAAFPVHALAQVLAGASFAVLHAVTATQHRFLPLAGLVWMPLLHRGWMATTLGAAGRRVRRLGGAAEALPSQEAILRAYAWSIGAMAGAAGGYAVLWSGIRPGQSMLAVSAFALAWTAGFVALPVPAGLGVREAVLIALLDAPAASIIAVSVVHRLVGIVVEALLAAMTAARPVRS